EDLAAPRPIGTPGPTANPWPRPRGPSPDRYRNPTDVNPMNRPSHPGLDDADPVAPACRPTTDRIQRVLDGEAAEGLDADPHSAVCPICRERIRAARLFLAAVPERPAVRAGLTDSILATVRADRRARLRRRVFAAVGGLAVAATVALVVLLTD